MPAHDDDTFVFAVCGDAHLQRALYAAPSFRRFANAPVRILAARCSEVPADVEACDCPAGLTDAQASRWLKTGLHRFLPAGRRYCYVDSDVFAVSPIAIEVFDRRKGVVGFGSDPGKTVRRFSRFAVRSGTLADAVRDAFGVRMDPDWTLWNGGVFVFDDDSRGFLETWHRFTVATFDDRRWRTRDQGTLAAAAWFHGLQDEPRLPREYNWLHKLHRGLRAVPSGFRTRQGTEVALLHFPLTYGDRSFESWRAIERMLPAEDRSSAAHVGPGGAEGLRPAAGTSGRPREVASPHPGSGPARDAASGDRADRLEIVWHGDWHGEVAGRLAEYLTRVGFSCRLERLAGRGGTDSAPRRGITVRESGGCRYALIDFGDMVGRGTSRAMRCAVPDPDCRLVLKSQYRDAMLSDAERAKVVPYTYFEKSPALFQAVRGQLLRVPKVAPGLFFAGSAQSRRGAIVRELAGIVENPAGRLPVADYYRRAAGARIGLGLPGWGNVCHREIEYFGMGVAALMPRLKNAFHEPLIPDVHYVSVEIDTTRDSAEAVAAAIRRRYEDVRDDDAFLEFVRANAAAWYERNVLFENSIPLTARLLGLNRGTESGASFGSGPGTGTAGAPR